MHPVERNTLDVLHGLLERLDPTRQGWCIDAGAGVQDWFGEHFDQWGYQAVIIEPNFVPTGDVTVLNIALTNYDGKITLYDGHDGNTASIHPDWQTVTGHPHPGTSREVTAMRYDSLCDRLEMKAVSCLKMDIEGSELTVIETLPDAPLKPKIVAYEYGGGFDRATGMGGWSEVHFSRTLRCLDILRQMGYTHAAHCEEDVYPFDLGEWPQGKWREHIGYGNLVVWREA